MFLYNLGIYLFQLGLKLAALFNPKARLWIDGRKHWEKNLTEKVNQLQFTDAIWFHCASLGEFEQGRPVIEKIKAEYPDQKIVLTFFSPSGYEIQKNYPLADLVLYLPADTPYNTKQFLSILQPKLAIFVKYEFWLNYLFELKRLAIPTFLISTVIKPHQSFFKWYGANFRKALKTYEVIFTQDQHSLELLKKLEITTGHLAGDTRFDRVLKICSSPKKIQEIEQFTSQSFVIIAGSSWQKDEEMLIASFNQLKTAKPDLKLIIAPHEIDRHNIERLKNLLYKNKIPFHLFSENLTEYKHPVLIINAIGLLSSIYQYGQLAFIGGGFNNGIHNILEPSVYGLPVVFGPNYKKFNEAFELIKLKAGFPVLNQDGLHEKFLHFITSNDELNTASLTAKKYVTDHSGATEKIYTTLKSYLKNDSSRIGNISR